MSYLVGDVVLNFGDKVIIRWPDRTETRAEFKDSVGYSHYFDSCDEEKREIRLTNHFMRLKGIYVRKDEE